ncbi:putative HTH-type transcriptional regulator [Aquimixticola soesokkakensis]|uniref:Putative HTH-type transcriptional regulator n=1 Tax=Aquimixticola soesokkakensis TaxID=1519096 RepID=A0A1Y5SGE5_9RHOB|nr:S24 family peptidase [Aquimixticola soesokkakensis]SLN38481.1 putative HTH-type transcriptional regulator [Aquimixticola soesokkakensis]
MTQTALAKVAGISKGSQILYEKGNAPTADYLAAVGEIGIDLVYILTGSRVQNIKPKPGTKVRDLEGNILAESPATGAVEHAPTPAGYITLPQFNVQASAGHGAYADKEFQLGALAFDRKFLKDRGAKPESCSIISASGDSMHPMIPDGSLLVVDHSQTEIRNGHIMVINVSGDLLVKRVRHRLDGTVELTSDNPLYPPEVIGTSSLDQLRVIGRVVYFCRTP